MAKSIEELEGIGPKLGDTFRAAGVRSVADLLEKGADRKGRRLLASSTGLSETRVLKCVNMADLFRVNGVASQYAELLESAGVDTVKELARRNAGNLADEMARVNGEKKLVRRPPSTIVVEGWISQAKKLPVKVTY